MSETGDLPLLLGLSGSLRKASHCTAVLRALQEAAAPQARMELLPLDEVPLYNQDLDTEDPPLGVKMLRAAVGRADGLVICSPEYNGGMSGVIKNALDWASRPYGKSKLKGKPVLIMTASPASTGGARAQSQLRDTLFSTESRIVTRPEVAIAQADKKVSEGKLVEEAALRFALNAVGDLLRDIRALHAAAA
ncbi:NAD(P)H-dependent oxidoreductase [Roseomonas sp. OT10]|uniref:NADPH-dependent FMN reductase n=1 Tax=Roseomonas cutis TaxID=2897332 RepID=UPI001E35EB6E|nr:NAD(P)H-dependent oxidoreductase [Roseomonas sp. OT10]UFN49783.1 NAD(P)H-dependent oxidoreductase [Roseomonas sp. OT10]